MEDTMEEENGREAKLKAEITRWLIFFGVAIMLSVMTWLGWSLTNRKNPITSFTTLVSDSSVAIGIQGSAPESLDIRTEQGTALEQALLENVYETLVSRSETNKLQPSIAKSWQISDDGLTYTFTLNSNMTFANGHKLDSSDVVWSLQNVINNNYVGSDQLGSLKEITNPDEKTVVITLNQPNPCLLRALSASAADELNQQSGINSDSGISFDKVMLAFNNGTESPFSDEQIRKMTRYAIDAQTIAKDAPDAYSPLGGPISPLEDGYEDLSELFPYNLEQGQQMRSYFGAYYIADIDLLVPKEYEQIGNTVKSAIEQLNIGVNLEVLDSAAQVTERMNAGTYNIALTTMSGENDASVFTDGQSVFHYENGDAQQAYADAMAATNDDDYQARMRTYARAVSENAASDWLYTRKNFMAVSDQLQGYPKNLTDRLLPLSRVKLQ